MCYMNIQGFNDFDYKFNYNYGSEFVIIVFSVAIIGVANYCQEYY